MINLEELRIGNIVLFGGQPIEVKEIRTGEVCLDGVLRQASDNIHFEFNPVLADSGDIQPFPLNHFLLEQIFGTQRVNGKKLFAYSPKHSLYFIDYDEQRDNIGSIVYERTGYFIGMYDGPKLIHITPHHFHSFHEIQNIHNAQFGYELPIGIDNVKRAWNLALNLGKV